MSKTKDLVIKTINKKSPVCECKSKVFCELHGITVRPIQGKTKVEMYGEDYWFNLITGIN